MARLQAIFRNSEMHDGTELYNYCRNSASRQTVIKEAIKLLNPDLHDVANKGIRPDKVTFVPSGKYDDDDKPIMEQKDVSVTRAPLPIQDYIIDQKASFASGSSIELKPTKEKSLLFDSVYRDWTDNKISFKLKDIFKRIMGETQCAIIKYSDDKAETFEDFRFRDKIVSPILGDTLEPIFDDDTDNMIAFGRGYSKGKDAMYDLYITTEYTNSKGGTIEIRRYKNGSPVMVDVYGEDGVTIEGQGNEIVPLPYTKLPIIYGEQLTPECWNTRHLIKAFEFGLNEFLTQQGYTGDPILWLKASGAIDMPAQGDQGKILISTGEKDEAKFLTADGATESRILQFDLLKQFIFGFERSVLMDASTMAEMSLDSGEAIKRALTDVYMQAEDKQNGYLGEFVQRYINWSVHEWRVLLGGIDKDLRVSATFIPKSFNGLDERIKTAQSAVGLATLETRVAMAGLEDNVQEAVKIIKQEQGDVGNNTVE